MTAAAKQRSNDDWVSDLSGERASAALSDLRQLLMRGLRASIGPTADNQREDFVQEALVRIAANLNSFRGDSRFETWAMALAIRVAPGGCKKDCVNVVLKQNEGERDETGPKQL